MFSLIHNNNQAVFMNYDTTMYLITKQEKFKIFKTIVCNLIIKKINNLYYDR